MLKGLFGKGEDVVDQYRAAGEQTGVFTLSLQGVADPFDADPLWDRRYGGVSEIFEEKSEDRDFRLQAALDGCRDVKFMRDDAGRFREHTPVFTDVVVWVAGKLWRADSQRGGRKIEALANNLTKLHHKMFRRSLPEGREPIYTVMPDDDLEDTEVVVQFGFGVYVPTDEDHLLGNVRVKRKKDDKEGKEFPEWSFWKDGKETRRPVGIWEGQGALLVTSDQTSPVRAPMWFGGDAPSGNISINLGAAEDERVYASEAEVTLDETLNPKTDSDPFSWVLKDSRAPDGESTLVIEVKFLEAPKTERAEPPALTPAVDEPPVLTLGQVEDDEPATALPGGRLKPMTPKVPQPVPADPKTQPPRARTARPTARGKGTGIRSKSGLDRFFAANERTFSRDPTPLSTRFSLKLSGCALLRIDGDRRLGGLEEWVIWFDRFGQPVTDANRKTTNTAHALALAATALSSDVFYRLPGEESFKAVQAIPCSLITEDGGYLDLLPSPVPEAYHGLLQLRPEASFPLSPEPLMLGRSDASKKTAQPDLPMELLDHPESLRWADGTGPRGAKLNSLNLSRRHVQLRLVGGKLEVTIADGKMPVYILDSDYKLLRTLKPGDPAPIMIDPDEFFIVGSYLMRFHQEKPQAMMTSDATQLRRAGAMTAR